MFRSMYESTWLHPVLFWIAGAALLLYVALRLPFLYGFLVAFGLEILADALLTGPWSPVPAGTGWATAAAIVFVILGDARYFVLVERTRRGGLSWRALAIAFLFALVVPTGSALLRVAFPGLVGDGRTTFLVYEVMFFLLAVGVRAWLPTRLAAAPRDMQVWAVRATRFEILQYALWALADVVILAGHDVGFALRVVPNTMYYALFLPFVAWTAPRGLREPWTAAVA